MEVTRAWCAADCLFQKNAILKTPNSENFFLSRARKKKSDGEFTATATNKIGPFNATFTGDIELKDLNPPNSYKISGSGNSPVGFASGEATVSLQVHEGGTKLTYKVEANVGGKIAQVGSRLIDMTAKKMADIFFGKFSELIVPQSKKAKSHDKIETQNLVVKNNSNPINKTLIYSIIGICLVIAVYYLLA